MTASITLVMPQLVANDPSYYQGLSLPVLGRMLAQGALTLTSEPNLMDWMGVQAGLNLPLPFALLAGSNLAPPSAGQVRLLATPVQLHAARSKVMLSGSAHLGVSEAEAQALLAALNAHFAEDGWHFSALSAGEWVVDVPGPLSIRTSPLPLAIGEDIDPLLPKGEGALQWHRALNELQMLLYNHPVNDARDARGAPLINGVWLWGEGALSHTVPATPTQLFGSGAVLAGLAHCLGAPLQALPAGLPDMAGGEAAWFYLPEAEIAWQAQDFMAWQQALQGWEANWLVPALTRLERGLCHSVRVVWQGSEKQVHCVRLKRADLWKFWRRRPLLVSLGVR